MNQGTGNDVEPRQCWWETYLLVTLASCLTCVSLFPHLCNSKRSIYLNAWNRAQHTIVQSCPTLCDPLDYSLPGSSVHGNSQAKIVEWVAISFSNIFLTQGLNPSPAHSEQYMNVSHWILAWPSTLHSSPLQEDYTTSPVDFGLGHETCLDQWNLGGWDHVLVPRRALKNIFYRLFILPLPRRTAESR